MKAGYFNINEYLEKLNEEMQGGTLPNKDGMVIPEENQKSFQWLKKEYQKAQVEVKVEINMGGAKFDPGYDLQTDLKSVKDFKPGMFGEVKTGDTSKGEKEKPDNLDAKKEQPNFQKREGERAPEDKKEEKFKKPETKPEEKDIKNKNVQKETHKKEETEEEETKDKEPNKEGETKVKKLDLKTKKK